MVFAVGSLVKGLYFQLASKHFGLMAGEVLFWRCHRHGEWVFYGRRCPRCGHEAAESSEPLADPIHVARRWLLVPSDRGGGFAPLRVFCCGKCESWVPLGPNPRCPRDGFVPSRKPVGRQVWIPTEGRNLELDALSEAEPALEAASSESDDRESFSRLDENCALLKPDQRRCAQIFLKYNLDLSRPPKSKLEKRLFQKAARELGLTFAHTLLLQEETFNNLKSLMLATP